MFVNDGQNFAAWDAATGGKALWHSQIGGISDARPKDFPAGRQAACASHGPGGALYLFVLNSRPRPMR